MVDKPVLKLRPDGPAVTAIHLSQTEAKVRIGEEDTTLLIAEWRNLPLYISDDAHT